ncbi:unnamed protein product [Rotaria sordida]|uniref:Uncharacterized protein n=1 Tax=Rotaria sordida TaxID=392033 RepID=A0A818Z5P9_9BILA|nr:unnamed protein product [Rotaria sordida]CAF3765065.1 unnamed protein product [Rotaria sordida]
MNIYWIFLIVAIIIPTYLTSNLATTNRDNVNNLEFTIFRLAPGGIQECDDFRHNVKPFDDGTDNEEDYLKVDCARYQSALTCYKVFYPLLDDNNPSDQATKKELDNIDLASIENACHQYV